MNSATILAVASLTAAVSVGLVQETQAYTWLECKSGPVVWAGSRTTMSINTVSMPPRSVEDKLLQNAMWHWNNVGGSSFQFFYNRDKDGTYRTGNGVNEIVYDDIDDDDTLAYADMIQKCKGGNIEVDLVFDPRIAWSYSKFNYLKLGQPESFEGTALHELGHALGLEHDDRQLDTMNTYYPSGGPVGQIVEWDPMPDAREGIRFLYRSGTSESNIAGTVLKTDGDGGAKRVTQAKTAFRGGDVTMELTMVNGSTARKTFNIGFYLSTNDVVSTSDRLLGTNTGAFLDPGVAFTFKRTVTIPNDVTPGTYFLGFWLDSGGNVGEWNENDNWSVHPQKLTVQ